MADGTDSNAGGTGDKGAQTSALGDDGATQKTGDGTALTGDEGKKAAETKGADGKTQDAPAEMKLKLPKGFDEKDATYTKFLEAAKKGKLSNEAAQALFDLHAEQQKAGIEKALADHDAEQSEWKDLLKSDKEFGGEKYDASLGAARQAMAKYATPAFRQFLRDSGLGNHPELFRFVFRVGKEMADDTIGNTGGAASAKPKSDAELLYGDTPAKQES